MASPFCLANSTDSRRIWIPVEACLAGYSMPRIKNLRIVIIPRSLPEIFAFYIYNLRLESKYILNSYSIVIDLFYFIISRVTASQSSKNQSSYYSCSFSLHVSQTLITIFISVHDKLKRKISTKGTNIVPYRLPLFLSRKNPSRFERPSKPYVLRQILARFIFATSADVHSRKIGVETFPRAALNIARTLR